MTGLFSSWILSVLGLAFIGILSDFIIPNGKMQSIVKTVVAIFSMLIVLKPLKTFDFSKLNFFNINDLKVNSQFVQTYQDEKIEKLKLDIENCLTNSGYYNVKLDIFRDEKDRISSICVDLSELVLSNKNLNTNKYTNIIAIIKQFVYIKEDCIAFYEWRKQ